MLVAIDGPAGSGKSTVARAVAARLSHAGFRYLDTGAMYRAVALLAMQRSIPLDDGPALGRLAHETRIEFGEPHRDDSWGQRIIVDGTDVTEDIRSPEVTVAVSPVSAEPLVRRELVAKQQEIIAAGKNFVLEGRDTTTVVCPHADLKVYMTASVDERALRRYRELKEKGRDVELEAIKRDIVRRDEHDMNRQADPLRQAEDAVVLDTTGLSFQGSVDAVMQLFRPLAGH